MTSTVADAGVRQLHDVEAIHRLIFDYAYHLDMNHPEELAALFVADCEVVYGPKFGATGREAFAKTLEGIGEYFQGTSHHVTNIVVDFTSADEATARSVLYAWHRYTKDRPDGHVWGQYHDVFVRTDDGWRFKRRELRASGTQDFHAGTLPIGRA